MICIIHTLPPGNWGNGRAEMLGTAYKMGENSLGELGETQTHTDPTGIRSTGWGDRNWVNNGMPSPPTQLCPSVRATCVGWNG